MDQIGLDIDKDFFFYKKQKDGGNYQYFLFPTIDKNLIEDALLMKTVDRCIIINKVVELLRKQKK
jgi:hypothetical protein